MARIPLQKVCIAGLKCHTKVLLKELHDRGVLEITENPDFKKEPYSHTDEDVHNGLFDSFDLARIEFAIDFLTPHAPKTPALEGILTGNMLVMPEKKALETFNDFSKEIEKFIRNCEEISDENVRYQNEIKKLSAEKNTLQTYLNYPFAFGENLSTSTTETWLVRVQQSRIDGLFSEISAKTSLFHTHVVFEDKRASLLTLTVEKSAKKHTQDLLSKFGVDEIRLSDLFADFDGQYPAEANVKLEERIAELKAGLRENETQTKEMAKSVDKLKISHDFFLWRQTKNKARSLALHTNNLVAIEGWVPAEKFAELSHWMKQAFAGEVIIEKVKPAEDEKEPALVQNKTGFASFQMITEMFGAPKSNDVDPTPVMAPFFMFFFGICLSDVGYGMILFLVSSFLLLFGKYSKTAREKIIMIFLCGISAVIGGVLLGGWFGMTPEQFPLLQNPATGDFYGQILNPLAGDGAMTFLLFSFAVGFVQLVAGVFMEGVRLWKNGDVLGAWCDGFTWVYFLISLVGWALADQIGLPKETFLYMTLSGAGIIVLTSGRKQKNIFAKLVFGILGLYGIMDYVSNMLSYSRLMALGLATGIIAAAMNTTAGVLGSLSSVPAIGVIISIFFLLFGHSLNFALSLLGAFIHSMRLQFIEFFGRFYSGGAPLFSPFKRAYKYLYLRD